MNAFFDRYTLGARVFPALIAGSPAFFAISSWVPIADWPIKLATGTVPFTIVSFALSQYVRDAGLSIQAQLWESWGGPPTVRMLRHSDVTIDPGIKALAHQKLVQLAVVPHMPTPEDEQNNPQISDKSYKTCSDWLRNYALSHKNITPFDVVHSENIVYGFRRNLLGIKRISVVIGIMSFILSLVYCIINSRIAFEAIIIALILAYILVVVNNKNLKTAADNYSIRLINAVQSIPTHKPAKNKAIKSK